MGEKRGEWEGGSKCVAKSEEFARVGAVAPAWKGTALLPDLDFADLNSEQFSGKWLVLFSYPLDFTFVCPTEIWAFSEAAPQFREMGVEVLGLSVDSVYSHLGWVNSPKKEGVLAGWGSR
jgi:alkyl hydroperoxide reductase subunit AhpC